MSAYLLPVLVTSLFLTFLTLEGLARLATPAPRARGPVWHLVYCVTGLLLSAALTAVFVMRCVSPPDPAHSSYVIVSSKMRFLVLILIAFCLVALSLVVLAVFIVKEKMYCKNGLMRFKKNKLKLKIPEFLISQTNAFNEHNGASAGLGSMGSMSPCSSSPKLLPTDRSSDDPDEEDEEPLPELPSPSKSKGSRLSINMAHILGRRRHTICQISLPAPVPKQYNYVRKFSVDVAALQAQLQNPKINKEAPFQSDLDISKSSKPSAPLKPVMPLQPLQPFTMKGKNNDRNNDTNNDVKNARKRSSGPNQEAVDQFRLKLSTPPPMIMVSKDESNSNGNINRLGAGEFNNMDLKGSLSLHSVLEKNEDDTEEVSDNPSLPSDRGLTGHSNNDGTGSNGGVCSNTIQQHNLLENQTVLDKGDLIQKEKIITEEVIDKETVRTEDDVIEKHQVIEEREALTDNNLDSDASESYDSDDCDLAKLSFLLCLTFCVSMLPLCVTELLRSSLDVHTYINVHAGCLAVSALQTIIYPQLISCSDHVVKRSLRKLKVKVMNAFGLAPKDDNIDMSITEF